MTLNEMLEKRNKHWESMKAFLDSRRGENGTLSAEDDEAYAKMEAELEAYNKECKRLENQERIDAELAKPVNRPLLTTPTKPQQEKTGRASDEYKNAMLTALRSNFKVISDILQEGVDADGGYLVPEEMDSRIIDVLEEENFMRGLATVINTRNDHKIAVSSSKPAAAWVDEGETLSFGDAKFGQVVLDAHKLAVAVKVTEELLHDSGFNLENYINIQFGRAIANAEEDAFLNGANGANKPTGIFAETGGGTVAASVEAKNLKTDNVLDLLYALKRPYRKRAAWIINDATVAAIRKLKDGNGAYIWQPSITAGEPDSLLGLPLYSSAYAPKDAMAVGDYSYYQIGDRGTRSFKALWELFAGDGMVGFVAKERVDGKLALPEAVQILKLTTV